ncbi:amino acid ABC transporter permease [Ferrovibrio xuzhouensis]|uniref:Amino acid ABC transporter permease n=1 Tax=Ferrovibrio xuzhouensis TaxID=1576914 RepID=A0ABV7VLP9_9PROT
MQYHWDFDFIWNSRSLLLLGVLNTFKLAVISLSAGLLIGLFTGIGRVSPSRLIRIISSIYTEFFRNVPGIVLIFWFYYAIPVLTGWQATAWLASTVALSLYTGAYCGEIYRAGIESIEKGQWEAARALGFNRVKQFRYIIIPQALSRMIPAFTNRAIELLKTTTLASSISLAETLYTAKLLAEDQLRPLESYTVAAFIFTIIVLPLSYLAFRLERRMRIAGGHAE